MQSSQQPSTQYLAPQASHSQDTVPKLQKFKPWVFKPKKTIYSLEKATTVQKKFSTSHWNHEENILYVDFLLKFRQIIEGEKKNRRKWHLNRIMSKHVGSRSHQQCRSHHQKMMKHYKSIQGIIDHITQTQREEISTEPSQQQLVSCNSGECVREVSEVVGECSIFQVLNWEGELESLSGLALHFNFQQ